MSASRVSSLTSLVYTEIKKGNYLYAIKQLQAISIEHEPSESLLSLLGYCYYMAQDYSEASNCYNQIKILLEQPGEIMTLDKARLSRYLEHSYNYANTLYSSGEFDLSIRATISLDRKLDKIISDIYIDEANGTSVKSDQQQNKNQHLSIETCQEYKSRLKTLQALIKFSQNDIAAARSLFDSKVNSSNPESKSALQSRMFNLASCLTKQKSYHEAIAILKSMIHSSPTNEGNHDEKSMLDVKYNLALNHYLLENYDEALDIVSEIIAFGVSNYPEFNIGSNTNDLEINSVGNSYKLEQSCLIEAFNLKASINYQLDDLASAKQALTDMPPRNQDELDSTTLHNLGLINLDSEPLTSFDKLRFLLASAAPQNVPLPDETFFNILLIYINNNHYDIAARLIFEEEEITFKYLSEEMFLFLDGVITKRSSHTDGYRKLDQLLERQMEKLRALKNEVDQETTDLTRTETNKISYNNELEFGIEILMSLGHILWTSNHFKALERLFRKTAEIFSDHHVWKLNVAHTLYMQDSKFKEVLLFYEPFIRDNFKHLLRVDPMVIANLCVSYVLIGQNEDAQELMRKVELEENELVNGDKTHQSNDDGNQLQSNSKRQVARQTLIKLKNGPRLSSMEDDLETKQTIDNIIYDSDTDHQNRLSAYDQQQSIPMHSCIINLVIGTLYCVKYNYEFGITRIIKSVEPVEKKLNRDTWFYAKRCILSMLENICKMTTVVSDIVLIQCIDFLMECEKYGLTIKASSKPTSAEHKRTESFIGDNLSVLVNPFEDFFDDDFVSGKDTVTYQARHLRWLMLKLLND